MSHAHDHHHGHAEAESPYYMDQTCLVAVSAAFGAVCLSLCFWRTDILKVMLADQFHPFVLVSGVILLILALLRGISLWIQIGKEPAAEDDLSTPALASLPLLAAGTSVSKEMAGATTCDDHGHAHCGHDHHHEGHAHAHGDHAHSHEHEHGHTHGHGDHEHTGSPWRYVFLLLPIILFLLGLPCDPPKVKASAPDVDYTKEAMTITSWIGLGTMPLDQAGRLMATAVKRQTGEAKLLPFQTLEGSAGKQEDREYWAGKAVRVKGQFVPNPNPKNKRVFSVGRFSINCCRQDAVQLNVPIISSEDIEHVKQNEWIQVTGEIQYRKDKEGVYHTQLIVHGKDDVVKIAPEIDPYISAK